MILNIEEKEDNLSDLGKPEEVVREPTDLPPQPIPSVLVSTPRPSPDLLEIRKGLTRHEKPKVLRNLFDADYLDEPTRKKSGKTPKE